MARFCLSRKMKGIISKIKLKYVIAAVSLLLMLDFFGAFTHIMEADYHSRFSYPLDIDLTEVLDYLRNNRQPSVQPINQYNYKFTIANEAKCKDENANSEEIVLLYLIKSALGHESQRDAIRNSWGFENRFSDVAIRRVFILGIDPTDPSIQRKIDKESETHDDIIQADFVDTYFNNTIKTMMGFQWVVNYCSKSRFIFLVDDDMYVSTKNLLKFLRNPLHLQMLVSRNKFEETLGDKNTPDSFWWNGGESSDAKGKPVYDGRLYAGFVFFSSPLRHKASKWYISLSEYPYSKYPPYVTAGAVSLTYPALLDMYYASRYTKHFRFDDIYMGILAKKVGIHPIHNNNVYFYKKDYNKEAFANVIASHGFGDPRELIRTWEEQKSIGNA